MCVRVFVCITLYSLMAVGTKECLNVSVLPLGRVSLNRNMNS